MKNRIFVLLLLVLIVVAAGCEQRKWEQSLESPMQVGKGVIDALNRADAFGLDRLRVNREEYLSWIWPAFPQSRPPSNFPGDFAWTNLNKNSILGINRGMKRYGNQELVFEEIRFERPTEEYKGFKLLRGTVLMAKNRKGEQVELYILGSVIENDGRYKLLSYKD